MTQLNTAVWRPGSKLRESSSGIYKGSARRSRNRAACCSCGRMMASIVAAGADWEGITLGSAEPQMWRKLIDRRGRVPVMRGSRMSDHFWLWTVV